MAIEDMVSSLVDIWPEKRLEIHAVAEAAGELAREMGAYPGTIAWDLVCFRTEQMLSELLALPECDLGRWEELWAATSRERDYGDGRVYRPPFVYRSLLGFRDAFDRMREMYQRRIEEAGPAFRELFIQDLFEFRSERVPTLSQSTLLVFRTALAYQTVSPQRLAARLGTSKGYVSRVLNNLRRRGVLWTIPTVSYAGIGLKTVIMALELEDHSTRLPPYLGKQNPWLYNVLRTSTGESFALVNIVVPRWWSPFREGRMWLESLADAPGVVRVTAGERDESLCWANIDYDLFDGSQWAVFETFHRRLQDAFENPPPVQLTGRQLDLEGFVLDESYLAVIDAILNKGLTSVRDIRRKVGRKYNTVLGIVADLRSRGILWERVVATTVYAPGSLFLVIHNSDVSLYRRICRALSFLPELYCQRATNGLSTVIAKVPAQYARWIFEDVRMKFQEEDCLLSYHGSYHLFGWKLPVSRWDADEGKWRVMTDDFGP